MHELSLMNLREAGSHESFFQCRHCVSAVGVCIGESGVEKVSAAALIQSQKKRNSTKALFACVLLSGRVK